MIPKSSPTRLARALKASVLVFMVWGLSGCAHSDPTRFYLLDMPAVGRQAVARENVTVGIAPVGLPRYLDPVSIALRTNGNEIVYYEFHRWAEPLRHGVPRALGEALKALCPKAEVYYFPWPEGAEPDLKISLRITRFDASANGTVNLEGYLTLAGARRDKRTEAFAIETPVDGTRAAEIARAMSEALEELARQIAGKMVD